MFSHSITACCGEKNQHEKLQGDFGVQMAKKINSEREKPIITWGSLTNVCHKKLWDII